MAKLTEKRALFAKEYLKDLNATKAAIRAGYAAASASVEGARLLADAKVAEEVQRLMDKRSKRVEAKADDVLRELIRIARADIRKAFKDDGSLKAPNEMPKELGRIVSSIETDELFEGKGRDRVQVGWTRKVKFWPKVQALELLGKHLKLFVDRMEHTGKDGSPLQVSINIHRGVQPGRPSDDATAVVPATTDEETS